MKEQLATWRQGRKVISVDDLVYRDSTRAHPYRVHAIVDVDGAVEASVYGGKPNKERWKTFPIERLTRYRRQPETKRKGSA